ncbi:SAVED domain-containing protein [Streptomyces goshikiensis]|uniref:SAVED domain-containing protein n=1 Tax=Streptomyces goshikiensis TaxID=1942 RepID=UPI00331DA8A1
MAHSNSRAASGARLLGDDVQHLIVWYHVLRTQQAGATVVDLAVEAAGAGNVDDMTLRHIDGRREYWQVKASVNASTPLNEEWLFEKEKDKQSLLQRLYASWVQLSQDSCPRPNIVLATTKAIEATDQVLAARATTDARIVETLRHGTGSLATARTRWADHLGVSEAELLEFLDRFEIRHAQSEKEWREKVRDAAIGARVRVDDSAIAVGVQCVRDWVKAPRQRFSPVDLSSIIDSLEIRSTDSTGLLVIQALEGNPRARFASHAIDWVELLAGDEPRTRRRFSAPLLARPLVLGDLTSSREQLRAAGIRTLEVDGPMRLPMWFAVGAHFGSTAGFTVGAQARDGMWWSSVSPNSQKDLAISSVQDPCDAVGRPWAVSVSFAVDIAEEVEIFLEESLPDAHHVRARVPHPGRAALSGLPHAQAVIFQLREELRVLRRQLKPPEVHLFLAMPAACALLLGHAWDRMPPTWTYWDMGEPGAYEAALRVAT